jgi:hypothetical protein
VLPGLRQIHHVGALLGREAATGLSDEDDDGVIGFLDGDRVALPVIVGDRRGHRDLIVVHAGAERKADADQGRRHPGGAAVGCSGFHDAQTSSHLSR